MSMRLMMITGWITGLWGFKHVDTTLMLEILRVQERCTVKTRSLLNLLLKYSFYLHQIFLKNKKIPVHLGSVLEISLLTRKRFETWNEWSEQRSPSAFTIFNSVCLSVPPFPKTCPPVQMVKTWAKKKKKKVSFSVTKNSMGMWMGGQNMRTRSQLVFWWFRMRSKVSVQYRPGY